MFYVSFSFVSCLVNLRATFKWFLLDVLSCISAFGCCIDFNKQLSIIIPNPMGIIGLVGFIGHIAVYSPNNAEEH